ncbi:interferon gamma receptor 1-like isoform X2 [Mugil cephalus]|uniref:interferon gamma receptor 1-like isoform X2 n=1 Tax=Mugil cephalus TaxID=48193 RepID=UPI001FB7CA0D|nr:interferon gamma receptor 1-like isoform X2 [Mugil cephalus]
MAWLQLVPIPVLLWTIVGASDVAPPTNITFTCHNFTNLLEWSYPDMQPGLRFRVDVNCLYSSEQVIWIDAPTLQADIGYHFNELEACMVQVTAVIGQRESVSTSEEGIAFSYGQNVLDVTYTCFVDHPFVNITVKPDDIVVFRFEHPWMVYRQKALNNNKLKSVKKRHGGMSQRTLLPEFNYEVVVVHHQEKHFSFLCETEVCEQTLPVHTDEQQHCLKFKGTIQQLLVQGREPYCVPQNPGTFNGIPQGEFLQSQAQLQMNTHRHTSSLSDVYLYVGITVLVLGTVVLIVFMLYRKTIKPSFTMPPKFDRIDSQRPQQIMRTYPDPVVLVEPTTPTLLLDDTDDDRKDLTPDVSRFPCGDLQSSSVMQQEDQGVSDDFGDLEEPKDDPEYMRGSKMDEDDMFPEESAYERRIVLVELGPDDVTEGYRG